MRIRTLFGFLPPRLLYSQQELALEEFPLPEKATILIDRNELGSNELGVKPGDALKTGQEIKSSDNRVMGISSITGEVSRVGALKWVNGEDYITIEIVKSGPEEWESISIGDYKSQRKEEFLKLLKNAGYVKNWTIVNPEAIIVNCFENDLLLSNKMHILKDGKDKLKKGLALLMHLGGTSRIILAVPENLKNLVVDICVSDCCESDCEVIAMKGKYPNGDPEYLKLKLGFNRVSEVVDVEELYGMVEFVETGRARVDKLLTVIDRGGNALKNISVRIGTPVEDILKTLNISLEKKERLVLGGPMKGKSVYNYEFPITSDTGGVFLEGSGEMHEISNMSCFNCGKCVKVCPYNLQVNLLSRYSEYSLFEKCEDYEIDSCIECGLCSYVCVSRRPLVQYIQFARREIEKMKEVQ